jgi:hypothetical protein
VALQGGEDGEGGGSDIGALLGNLGPLLGGLSGVSYLSIILSVSFWVITPCNTICVHQLLDRLDLAARYSRMPDMTLHSTRQFGVMNPRISKHDFSPL